MRGASTFHEVLDAVEQLSLDEQEMLVGIVRRRLAERGHQRVIAHVQEAQLEFEAGHCRHVTVKELMDEVLS